MIKVLYVEPQEFSLALTRASKEDRSCNIDLEVSYDAEDALTKIKNNNFGCVLLGHSPPSLNGLELTRKIREISPLPIIFYSSPDYNLIKNALDAGANDFIIKTGGSTPLSVIEKRVNLASTSSDRSSFSDLLRNWLPNVIKIRDLNQIASLILKFTEEFYDFDISNFFILEQGKLSLIETRIKNTGIKIDLDDVSPISRAIREKIAIQVEQKNVNDVNIFKEIKSELVIPIKSDDNVIGVLNFYSFSKTTYSEVELEELKGFAEFVGFIYSYLNEIKLRESVKEFQEKILDSVSDAIYIIDSEKFIFVNKKGAEILGYSEPTDVIGSYAYKFITPENKDFIDRISSSMISEKNQYEKFKLKLLRRDGFVIETEVVASRVIYDGKPGYLTICKGISDWNGRAQEFRKYTSELKNLIDKQTQELFEAEQMASAGKLASMVGHDLRSPLQSIRNAAYLIRTHPEQLNDMLKLIDESVDRSLSMLEELRQKTRETPVNVQTIDLGAFISKTIKEIPIPESVKVNIRHAASVKTVEIDPVKIRRVLENLIRNAVEAMNAVGRLSILTLDLGDTFQIKVSDTGVGIPSDKIQFLFKPFYTTKEKGLGLGLSYSQKAIEAHSGKIDVESKLGEGTTFILTIPKRHYVEDEGKPTLNK